MSIVFGHANPSLQRHLLQLCFGQNNCETAINAIDQALINDTLSGEQLRVLPLLYKKSALEGLSSSSRTQVVNIYKHTLYRNSVMLARLSTIQSKLFASGFNAMIGLKGLPALAYINQGLGARPMADVDILVPQLDQRKAEAYKMFGVMGFHLKDLPSFRSMTLLTPENLELDVHWYLHDWAPGNQLVAAVNMQACTHSFLTHQFRIPCAEHHLAHVLAHGVFSSNLRFDARWIFDFVATLQSTQALSVERFAEFANQTHAPECLREALENIAIEMPDTIPIDRQQLMELRSALASNNPFISWLYKQTPIPNTPEGLTVGLPKLNRLKSLLIAYWLTPKILKQRLNIGFFKYIGSLQGLDTPTNPKILFSLAQKILTRGPALLYRLTFGR
jgi:hypothetical protein